MYFFSPKIDERKYSRFHFEYFTDSQSQLASYHHFHWPPIHTKTNHAVLIIPHFLLLSSAESFSARKHFKSFKMMHVCILIICKIRWTQSTAYTLHGAKENKETKKGYIKTLDMWHLIYQLVKCKLETHLKTKQRTKVWTPGKFVRKKFTRIKWSSMFQLILHFMWSSNRNIWDLDAHFIHGVFLLISYGKVWFADLT